MDISDLQDDEIKDVYLYVQGLTQKWARKPSTQRNLEEMCKEAEAAMHKKGILIKMHLQDLLVGGYPVLEIIGKLDTHEAQYGFDHEKKRHDVLKANERGEKFLGQKGKSA